MSRIGNNPISVPDGVHVDIQPKLVTVKGKLGEPEGGDEVQPPTAAAVENPMLEELQSLHPCYQ